MAPPASPQTGGRPARRRRAVVVLATLVVSLVALETGLRLAGYGDADRPYRFVTVEGRRAAEEPDGLLVPDDRLFWRLRPDWRGEGGARIGPRGFRTGAFSPAKPAGVVRIACLGDSSVFGLGVPEHAAWAARAGSLTFGLADARETEFLNLGVPGYTSWQGRLLLEDPVLGWTPDVVVLAFGAFNDWVPAMDAPDRDLTQGRAGSRIVRLLADAAGAIGAPPAPFTEAQDVSLLDTRTFDGPRRVPLAEFVEDLAAMQALAEGAGASVVLVSQPLPAATVERNPIALEYAAALRRFARETGLPLVDGWKAFQQTGLDDATLFRDFCHPSERGHLVLANALADKYRDR